MYVSIVSECFIFYKALVGFGFLLPNLNNIFNLLQHTQE